MTVGLGLGTSRFPFDAARDYFRWIEHCEEAGVNSIWQTDRLVTNESMLECMSAMAVIAGHTERIRFGMNVASIALRDPLLTARQCATIDFLSDGRLLPAFGLGSAFSRDYVATGTPTKRRGKKADEALELLARLGGVGCGPADAAAARLAVGDQRHLAVAGAYGRGGVGQVDDER